MLEVLSCEITMSTKAWMSRYHVTAGAVPVEWRGGGAEATLTGSRPSDSSAQNWEVSGLLYIT